MSKQSEYKVVQLKGKEGWFISVWLAGHETVIDDEDGTGGPYPTKKEAEEMVKKFEAEDALFIATKN